jgi:hypothetical protein
MKKAGNPPVPTIRRLRAIIRLGDENSDDPPRRGAQDLRHAASRLSCNFLDHVNSRVYGLQKMAETHPERRIIGHPRAFAYG